jgi:hypothetical protein
LAILDLLLFFVRGVAARPAHHRSVPQFDTFDKAFKVSSRLGSTCRVFCVLLSIAIETVVGTSEARMPSIYSRGCFSSRSKITGQRRRKPNTDSYTSFKTSSSIRRDTAKLDVESYFNQSVASKTYSISSRVSLNTLETTCLYETSSNEDDWGYFVDCDMQPADVSTNFQKSIASTNDEEGFVVNL